MENNYQALLNSLEKDLRFNRFSKVDNYLKNVSVIDLEAIDILVVLTITSYGKDHLPSRSIFLEQAESALKIKLGAERAENLLKNRR